MSLVISNIETCALPPKTAFSLSSALIIWRLSAACRSAFLMYSQTFFVTSVRGSGLLPTTAASSAEGVSSFMNAALGLRAAAGFFAAAFGAAAFAGAAAFLAAGLAAGLAAAFFAG